MEKLVDYALFLVKSICKDADSVNVELKLENEVNIVDIYVSESDMGAVIGKSGKMASSLRTLLIAYAYLNNLGKVKINFNSLAWFFFTFSFVKF